MLIHGERFADNSIVSLSSKKAFRFFSSLVLRLNLLNRIIALNPRDFILELQIGISFVCLFAWQTLDFVVFIDWLLETEIHNSTNHSNVFIESTFNAFN